MSDGLGPTLDQRRARHAWDAVARISGSTGARQKSYRREVKRLSIRILTAGLGHALAFLDAKSKSENANEALLRDIADWVIDKRHPPDSSSELPRADSLMQKIIHGNGTFLQIATDEVLAYLQWLTRFAEAELEDDES